MSEATRSVTDIFTGKGGTIRLAIVGSLFSAIIFEIIDSKYDFRAKTSSGASISLTPGCERTMTVPLDSDNAPNEELKINIEEKAHKVGTSGQAPTKSQTEEKTDEHNSRSLSI